MKRFLYLMAAVFCLSAAPAGAVGEEAAVVGRITEIAGGELLRYDVEAGEWVALVPDAPFGIDDALYTDERARAEILIPNGTLVRLDHYTQVLSLSLEDRLTRLQLSEGRMRVASSAEGAAIEVQTGFGRIQVPSGAAADVAADDQMATVTAVDGIVEVLWQNGDSYRVQPGESLSLTDGQVASVATAPPSAWTDWNQARDRIWAARQGGAESSRYLPVPLTPYAHELDAYGEWRRVQYAGGYHWLWHPTRVAVGWSPFTYGRWVTWYGDPCWIPAEPFGFVTHHYGSWEYLGGLWFWVPPNLGIGISLRYGWYPGRVGWVSYGGLIGWYPLLWSEPWYARRHWGLHSYPYARYRHGRHHHAPRAVVVAQDQFYRSRSYATHRDRHVAALRFVPTSGPDALSPLRQDRRRFYTKGAPAVRIPHPSVTQSVRQRIDTKRHRPELFRPALVEKSGPPSPGRTAIGGPRLDPQSRIEGRSMEPPARTAPSHRPDRLQQRTAPPNRPDRLNPRSAPGIQRHRATPPASVRQMQPVPPRPERFQGRPSDLERAAPEATEKPSRRDAVRPGPAGQRPMVSPQALPAEPPPVVQKRPRAAESQPRQRIQRPEAPSQGGQGAVPQAQPRIFPAPGQPRMQKPAVPSAPRQRPATSLQRQTDPPARSGRPEQARVLGAPPQPREQGPMMASPPRQRPSVSSRSPQNVSPQPQPEQRAVVPSPAPPQQMERPFPSRRHTGGRQQHRDNGGLR